MVGGGGGVGTLNDFPPFCTRCQNLPSCDQDSAVRVEVAFYMIRELLSVKCKQFFGMQMTSEGVDESSSL